MNSSLNDEITAIDDEIRALEDLILLQRRKADLLRRKSTILNSNHTTPNSENSGNSLDNGGSNKYSTISKPSSESTDPLQPNKITSKKEPIKPMEISTSEDKLPVQSMPNENQHMYTKISGLSVADPKTLSSPAATSTTTNGSSKTTNKATIEAKSEIIPETLPDSKTGTKKDHKSHHPIKWSMSDELLSPGQTLMSLFSHHNHKQHEALTSIQRMSRMTNDLANERNLLSWGRTAMACIRTSAAFTVFTGTTHYGDVAVKIVTIGFIAIGIYALAHGTHRYRRIKDVLNDPDPAAEYKRFSNLPLFFILFCVFVLVLVTQASVQWER